MWASGKVGKDTPAGRRAKAMGGVWVRVGGVVGIVGLEVIGG